MDNNQKPIQYIRQIAKSLLYIDPVQTKIPFVISHPFANISPAAILTPNAIHKTSTPAANGYLSYLDLTTPADLSVWRRHISKFIDENEFEYILSVVNKPYRLFFIYKCMPYLTPAELGKALQTTWSCVENIHTDPNLSFSKILQMFKKADKLYLMTVTEQNWLRQAPKNITLYRGVTGYNRKYTKAFSWTTDKKIALWFANRYNDEYKAIWEITVPKQRILCYFDRGEKEVIVNLHRFNQQIKIQELQSAHQNKGE